MSTGLRKPTTHSGGSQELDTLKKLHSEPEGTGKEMSAQTEQRSSHRAPWLSGNLCCKAKRHGQKNYSRVLLSPPCSVTVSHRLKPSRSPSIRVPDDRGYKTQLHLHTAEKNRKWIC